MGRMIPETYALALSKHPMATESAIAAFMAGLGDVLAQTEQQGSNNKNYKEKASSHNLQRTFHFMIKGCAEGIAWSYWYRMAERWSTDLTRMAMQWFVMRMGVHTTRLSTATAVVQTIISLVLDLVLACPILYSLLDIPIPALLNGASFHTVRQQVVEKLPEMMIASFKIWTPVNIIIYNIPLEYRVGVMSTADVFWQSIVSKISSRDRKEPKPTANLVLS